MANNALLNATLLNAGLIDAIPTAETVERKGVSILTPLTNATIESLYANDAECQRLEQELYERRLSVASANAPALYTAQMVITRYSEDGSNTPTQETVDVQGAAAYAQDIISVRANLRDKFQAELETVAPHLHAELEGIKAFLKSNGFNTQYGANGIFAIKRVVL